MTKKVVAFIVIVSLGVLGWSSFHSFKEKYAKTDISNPYLAIPSHAAIVINISNWGKFSQQANKQNPMLDNLKTLPLCNNLTSFMTVADSLYQKSGSPASLANKPLVISIHPWGPKRSDLLFIVSFDNQNEISDLKEFLLEDWFTPNSLSQRIYNEVTLYSCPKGPFPHETHFAFSNGLFISSTSPVLLEEAVRQTQHGGSLNRDDAFCKVAKTQGKEALCNVFINFKTFPNLLKQWTKSPFHHTLKNLASLSQWAELDVSLKEKQIWLNGLSFFGDSIPCWLGLLKNQETVNLKTPEALPASTLFSATLAFRDWDHFYSQIKKYYTGKGKLKELEKKEKSLTSTLGLAPHELFQTHFNDEISVAFIPSPKEKKISRVLLLQINSQSQMEKTLDKIIHQYSQEHPQDEPLQKEIIQLDNSIQIPIFPFPHADIFSLYFGNFFQLGETKYAALNENCLIISDSKKTLQDIFLASLRGKTLDQDPNFQKFTENFSNSSNFFAFLRLPATGLSELFLTPKCMADFKKHSDALKKYYGMGLQFSVQDKMSYNTFMCQYQPDIKEEPQTVWQTLLDSSLATKPNLVVNHYTKEKEIFVQDSGHRIYLITPSGRVIWNKPLNESIVGPIHQIDFYKNGKLQFLFSTKNRLHLIDRNGNYVEHYPINLPAPTHLGLSLCDYDKNRNYRIFVPTENQRILLYNQKGKQITDWAFNATESAITTPIQHFRIKGKDYIITSDKNRIYILDRKGNERISLEKQFGLFPQTGIHLATYYQDKKPCLVTVDTKKNLRYIFFDGKVKLQKQLPLSGPAMLTTEDLDADNIEELIIVSKNKLITVNGQGEILFQKDFDHPISSPAAIYTFSATNKRIGITIGEEEKIFLFNSDGSSAQGFPLTGKSPFSIGLLSKESHNYSLIVGGEHNYIYNYAVN